MEYLNGRMAEDMKDNGYLVNKMELAYTIVLKV